MTDAHVLDNAAYTSLTGPHAALAERRGRVVRYPTTVSPFAALPEDAGPADWADLAALAGPGAVVPLTNGEHLRLPESWEVVMRIPSVQLLGDAVTGSPDDSLVRLGAADVPEMLDLIARTQPGPFRPRTVEMGTYLGVRHGGALIAMAGERLHPPGWTEISAVCTDPARRGLGLAGRLVRALVAGIRDRGETPFLHASAENVTAIRLYESLGFQLRRNPTFLAVRVPAARTEAEAQAQGQAHTRGQARVQTPAATEVKVDAELRVPTG
ncbi:GNAT family N-acetyltransferase [Embleya sp. AB8]|uniref:GNAT family N-acetyltransferase n=1 Tax=Embleya sp. AB8 TaxID=3156304 RepID=UPI003C712AE5